jgi:hypothetical protein
MIISLGDVCDSTFVGPLTPEQSLICNLQAGISYRDDLLSTSSATPAMPLNAGLGSGNIFLYVVLAVVVLGLLKK